VPLSPSALSDGAKSTASTTSDGQVQLNFCCNLLSIICCLVEIKGNKEEKFTIFSLIWMC